MQKIPAPSQEQTWKLSSSLQLSLWHSGLPQRHPTGFMDALWSKPDKICNFLKWVLLSIQLYLLKASNLVLSDLPLSWRVHHDYVLQPLCIPCLLLEPCHYLVKNGYRGLSMPLNYAGIPRFIGKASVFPFVSSHPSYSLLNSPNTSMSTASPAFVRLRSRNRPSSVKPPHSLLFAA